YEIQLKSISSQIDTIDKVNVGLNRIREMYEGSTGNSQKFNEEAEKMAQQIEELNAVYARMLQAMTVNMK
ncbi:MAG: gliding motility protein GldL, partial [Bacteroides sp.]